MKRKGILIILSMFLVLGLLLSGVSCTSETPSPETEDVIVLTSGSPNPEGAAPVIAYEWWIDEVEKRTNGRVEFDKVWSGALGSFGEQPNSVQGGLCDIGQVTSIYNPGLYPAAVVVTLPFLTDSLPAITKAGHEFMSNPEILAECAAVNQKPIFALWTEPMEIMCYEPATNVEELKGLKIRGHGGSAEAMTAAGLTSVAVPWDELPSASQQRVVDGASMPVPITAVDYGYQDIYPYALRVPMYYFHFWVAFNIDSWNKLPADIQQIMLEAAEDTPEVTVQGLDARMAESWQIFAEAGVEEVPWSKEALDEFKQLGGAPVWDKWIADTNAAGLPGTELFDTWTALLKKYGG